jgi:hypothetical protein
VSVLINKTLSGFNFSNTVKHEQAVSNYKIHSGRLRGRREGGRKRYGGKRERGQRTDEWARGGVKLRMEGAMMGKVLLKRCWLIV